MSANMSSDERQQQQRATPAQQQQPRRSSPTGPPSTDAIRFGPFDVTTQVFLRTPLSFALVNLKPILPGHVLVCPRARRRRLPDLSPAETADLFVAVQRVQAVLARVYFEGGDGGDGGYAVASRDDDDDDDARRGGSFTVAVQDGPEAGQTVPHVHVHVFPRPAGGGGASPGSRARRQQAASQQRQTDAVYDGMVSEAGNVGGALWDRQAQAQARVQVRTRDQSSPPDAAVGPRPTPGGALAEPMDGDAARVARDMADMEAEAARYRAVLREMEGGQ